MKILKKQLAYRDQMTNALLFLPEKEFKTIALMTHGYTSHKASILNWGARLSEQNTAVLLFDLPGHYLGSYSEVIDINYFMLNGPKLFEDGLDLIERESKSTSEGKNIILLGHSLGALFATQALARERFKEALTIGVGFGLLPEGDSHFFLSPLFKKTLEVRSQVVSPALNPEAMFERINKEKKELNITNKKIHLISGLDDVVVKGKAGIENLVSHLQKNNNEVSVELVKTLPHHMPEMATPHIFNYLKKNHYF